MNIVKCDAENCDADIYWERSAKTGKWVPLSVTTGRSHFLDCADPKRFSGRNK
jgi:hypothetical protein